MKTKMEHWAVIKPSHIDGVALVIISSKNPSTIYWNGGPSYMTNAKYEILEDITIDANTGKGLDALDALEISMYQNHYKKYEPAIEPLRSEGWISPDGKIYYCGYGEHIHSARPIVAKIYGTLEYNPEEFLEDNKWLKIYRDGMIIRGDWSYKCTQAQINAVGWLCNATNATPEWLKKIKDHIRMFEVEE